MNSSPVDAAVRTRVVDPARSFIVQAPAGSGKTELLIQRYLCLLSRVEYPEEVIAITFTRKAAAEMRERIHSALVQVRTGGIGENDYTAKTLSLARAVLERNLEAGWHLEENPGRLRIQTIDSLCAIITRQMPLLSQFGGQPAVVEDPSTLYEQAATNTINTVYSDEYFSAAFMELLLHIDNNLPRIRSLLVEMLGKRDQWSRYIYAGNNRQTMERTLEELVTGHLHLLGKLFPRDLAGKLCTLVEYASSELEKSGQENILGGYSVMDKLPGDAAADLGSWRALAVFLLTKTGNWRRTVDVRCGFPSPASAGNDAEIRRERKAAMLSLLQELQDIPGLEEMLATVRLLPEPHYSDEEWAIVNSLCSVLRIAAAELKIVFSDSGQCDFSGITEAAISALGSDDDPTDLALYLDYQIKHILIDEFQDISVNQYLLIERIVSSWSREEGRTLFLVGDPMQSIYRFREAEVGRFLATFQSQHLAGVKLEAVVLGVNFRSANRIIDWVNDRFQAVFPAANDEAGGAVKYTASIAGRSDFPGSVTVYPFFAGQEEMENAEVVRLIQGIRSECPGDSIALLVRNRSHLRNILPLLKDAGLGFQALDIDTLGEQQYVQDLLALTRAILQPADRVAWLAVLRAPWCGLRLDDLYRIVAGRETSTIYESCINVLQSNQFEKNIHTRLQRVVDIFTEVYTNRQRSGLRRVVESAWCSLGGPATLQNSMELKNIRTCLDLLADMETAGDIDDLELLNSKINELYEEPDSNSENDIQIMTIHRAKGLEFDHVVIPQLGRRSRSRKQGLLSWLLKPSPGGYYELLLSPIGQTGGESGKLNSYMAYIEKSRDTNEESRLMYVAATRARQSLHILGSARPDESGSGPVRCKPLAGSLLSIIWPAVETDFIKAMETDSHQAQMLPQKDKNTTLARLADDWDLPVAGERVQTTTDLYNQSDTYLDLDIEFDWAGETIKHIGTVVHQCLAQIAFGDDPGDRDMIRDRFGKSIRAALIQAGLADNELDNAEITVVESISNMFTDETGKWIVSGKHSDIKNEYGLSALVSGKLVNIIMDRTFIDDKGVRWIIDYKTSRHEGGDIGEFLDHEVERYRNKLELYGHVMSKREDNRIMLGLYFPLLQAWRCWSYDASVTGAPE